MTLRSPSSTRTTRLSPLALATTALAAASLACTSLNTLVPRSAPQLTPVPQADSPTAAPGETQAPPDSSGLGADAVGPFQIEGGPTVASPRDARAAIESQEATALLDLAPESQNYTNEDLNTVPGILRYTVKLDQERQTMLFYGWCAKGQDLLEQNLHDMTIEFKVGDTVIPEEQLLIARSQQPDVNTGETLVCQSYYAVLSDWPEGETMLTVTIDFTKAVNDGISEYGPGTQEMIYTVTR